MVAFSHKNTGLYATNYDTLWNTVEPEAGPISNWRKNSVNTKSVLCCSLRQNVSMRKSHSYTPPLWKRLTVYISKETESSYTLAHRRKLLEVERNTYTQCATLYEVKALFAKYYINLYRKAFSCYLLICTPLDTIRGGFNVPMCALYACVRVLRLIS